MISILRKKSAIRITPFEFTPKQRERLVSYSWKRPSDRKKAECFIEDAEREIARWLTFATDEPRSKASVMRNKAERIQKTAQKLRDNLNACPEDLFRVIDVKMKDKMRRPHVYHQYNEATRYLCEATKKERPDLYHMANILNCWLSLLGETAGEVAAKKSASGENKGREKHLINTLEGLYELHFGKSATSSNDTNFRKFCAELSKILGYTLGAVITKKTLKSIPENRHISTKKAKET